MRRRLRATCAAALIATTGVVVSTASAAPFEPARVPRDATWVLHVDTQIVFESRLWGIIQEGMDETTHLRMHAGIELFRDFTGVDVLTDLHDVTLYGHGFEPGKAVLVLHGEWDPATLTGLLQGAKDYQLLDHGEHAVHRWTDDNDNKTKYGSFVGNNVIVISESEETTKNALDVLDDSADRAMQAEGGPARPEAASGLMAFVTADGIEALRASGKARSPIFNRIRAGWISVSETDNTLTLHANVEANSPLAARQVLMALNGLKSFAGMTITESSKPSEKTGIGLLDSASAVVEAQNVVLDWPISLGSVRQLVNEVAAERDGSTTRPSTAPTEP